MKTERIVEITNEIGNAIRIPLSFDDEREASVLRIDGVFYHFERISNEQLVAEYKVDSAPDYQPKSDSAGYCYILAPFSK